MCYLPDRGISHTGSLLHFCLPDNEIKFGPCKHQHAQQSGHSTVQNRSEHVLQGKHSPVVLVTNGCQKGLSKGRRETVTFLDACGEVLSSVYTWVLSFSCISGWFQTHYYTRKTLHVIPLAPRLECLGLQVCATMPGLWGVEDRAWGLQQVRQAYYQPSYNPPPQK